MNKSSVLTDKLLLSHIIDQCDKIIALTSMIDKDTFLENVFYQDALSREIEIIGEAAGSLSDSFCINHPDVPIVEMKSMRNVIVHQYFRVDTTIIWETAIHDIPAVYPIIKQIFDGMS